MIKKQTHDSSHPPKSRKTFPTTTPLRTHTFITSREGTAICSQICRHFLTVKCCNFLLLCSRIGTEIEICSPLVAQWYNHPHDLYLETCSWYCSVLFSKIILDRHWLAYVCLIDLEALVCCGSIFPNRKLYALQSLTGFSVLIRSHLSWSGSSGRSFDLILVMRDLNFLHKKIFIACHGKMCGSWLDCEITLVQFARLEKVGIAKKKLNTHRNRWKGAIGKYLMCKPNLSFVPLSGLDLRC